MACGTNSLITFPRVRFRHAACIRESRKVERGDRFQKGACKIDSPPDVRRDRFEHRTYKRNSLTTEDDTDSITGRVTDCPVPTNDETYYSTEHLRESPQPLMDNIDSSKGHIVETLH